ncbi:MAG TPA: PQQ-dependent sugar dehydrogenase [Candidatus Nanoarchaeia archaeon]|nr:PQQ-dependent sugar dehydrogenase [Candidatus Nanoarchaeia archaeon]
MKRDILIMVLLLFLVVLFSVSVNENILLEGVVIQDLDTVWSIAFLPNGNMLFTERPGRLHFFDGTDHIIAEINVSEVSESGLMGLAVDPEYESNHFIYLYYTHEENENRIARFTLENNRLLNEVILIDNILAARFHDGGRLAFGPDGKLYATTGDATIPSTAQDLTSLSGKILRMNKDGSIPEDNPFQSYVWSYGHRNPQGIVWNNDVMYASEHGPSANDEINIIEKGNNYGWPSECSDDEKYTQPIRCFTEFTLAPGGIAVNDNILYVAGLRSTQLRKLTLDGRKILKEEVIIDNIGRIRDVVRHDGYLYIGTSNNDGRGLPHPHDDKIIRVTE